jgi:hypothetical protein
MKPLKKARQRIDVTVVEYFSDAFRLSHPNTTQARAHWACIEDFLANPERYIAGGAPGYMRQPETSSAASTRTAEREGASSMADVNEVLDRLLQRIECNVHDLGEMGRFVRVEYVQNFIRDEKSRLELEVPCASA